MTTGLLTVTMIDSVREYRALTMEIDGFITWFNRTVGTGTSCYAISSLDDDSKVFLAYDKIISFKVLRIVD